MRSDEVFSFYQKAALRVGKLISRIMMKLIVFISFISEFGSEYVISKKLERILRFFTQKLLAKYKSPDVLSVLIFTVMTESMDDLS